MEREVIAGFNAGVIGTILGYPLDTIKTTIQTRSANLPYTLTMKQASSILYSEGGILAFYRGLASPLVALVILNTLNFSAYANMKERLGVPKDKIVSSWSDTVRVAFAAACVGPLASTISTPFELVKTQMQLNLKTVSATSASSSSSSGVQSRSSLVHAVRLVRSHGVSILYRGHGVNTAREMVFLSTYFSVYENTKSLFMKTITIPAIAVPIAGGFSGAAGWLVSFPLGTSSSMLFPLTCDQISHSSLINYCTVPSLIDLIKANIQGHHYTTSQEHPPSTYSIAKNLLRTKGFLGLYSGVVPSIARAFLVSSSRFSAYEITMWLLSYNKKHA